MGNEKTRALPPRAHLPAISLPPRCPHLNPGAAPAPAPRRRNAHPGGEGMRSSSATPISMGRLHNLPPVSSFRCRPFPAQTFNEHRSPRGCPHGGRWGGVGHGKTLSSAERRAGAARG